MSKVVQVPAGSYRIGSDSIPSAGPRHRHRFRAPFWIDAVPVSWAHFEVFVSAGGYDCKELWADLETQAEVAITPQSVDARCRTLLEASRELETVGPVLLCPPRDRPITGVTWFEALAMCRFFGARLPFEAEWEAAMQGMSNGSTFFSDGRWQGFPRSRFGCSLLTGAMQEWTGDPFLPRYFHTNANARGRLWSNTCGIREAVVRGTMPQDLYQDIAFRVGSAPDISSPFRGFRRVWDTRPRQHEIDPIWRSRVSLPSL